MLAKGTILWVSFACNAITGLCFLVTSLTNPDGMAAIGKSDDNQRAQFITHMNGVTNAHAVVLALCLGGIIADYFASQPINSNKQQNL